MSNFNQKTIALCSSRSGGVRTVDRRVRSSKNFSYQFSLNRGVETRSFGSGSAQAVQRDSDTNSGAG
ncbi:hypothetical protein NIES2104_05170 [Leptolyngbya sp. NIES-2104]|nr:hypothetical protein NIES2104_05170 [Leptolyngbya sp. NIES-2104]